MRMWMIPTACLCRSHLLGEHSEIHKQRHNFVKQHKMHGRCAAPAQIEPDMMQARHDKLVAEMLARGYNHQSPFEQPDVSYLGDLASVRVDLEYNLKDLSDRCPECAERIRRYYEK